MRNIYCASNVVDLTDTIFGASNLSFAICIKFACVFIGQNFIRTGPKQIKSQTSRLIEHKWSKQVAES